MDIDTTSWNVVGPSRYAKSRRRAAQIKAQASKEESDAGVSKPAIASTQPAVPVEQQPEQPVVQSLGEPNKPKPKKKKKKKSKKAKLALSSKEGMATLLESLLEQTATRSMLLSSLSERVKEITGIRSWNKDLKSKFGTLKNFLTGLDTFEVDGDFAKIVERSEEASESEEEPAVAEPTPAVATPTQESTTESKSTQSQKSKSKSKKGKKNKKSRRKASAAPVSAAAVATPVKVQPTPEPVDAVVEELPSSNTANRVMPFMLLGFVLVSAGLLYKKVLLE